MATSKWGESFLKSGLPLEHLAIMTFSSLGWDCSPHYDYLRKNREGRDVWFEIDVVAYSPIQYSDDLRLLVECKYHDTSRFWFFLPCVTSSHTALYHALEAVDTVETNDRVFHYAPVPALSNPQSPSALGLAPKSLWGVVVGADGTKQENAIETALHQLAYAFVPYALENHYNLTTNRPTALLPVIVTNAKIFRLKPEITDLEKIREASSPAEVAEALDWTWCYYAPNGALLDHNLDLIDNHDKEKKIKKYSLIENQLVELWASPSWIAVINIDALPSAIETIYEHFLSLTKDYRHMRLLTKIMNQRRKRRK